MLCDQSPEGPDPERTGRLLIYDFNGAIDVEKNLYAWA